MDRKSLAAEFDRNLVYIKEVAVVDLPPAVRDDFEDLDALFAVHDAGGAQLALVANRQLAVHLAHENELVPAAVH